ncbi:hypothetical protein Acr_27g0006200 [Actinidia rufa]|uniref:Uncharacterized protein n=1 Tax=Actinidia rufa TaxID=165716 RepID=A0A7J0H770_9ERIC|nr:hypothetical protein Acr_27g0006200 [Actinidia rufa]
MSWPNGNRGDAVIDMGKPVSFTGGLEFSNLTYTMVTKKEVNGTLADQEVDLLHRITGYARKGCITAVLAGRIASGSLKGRVSMDGVDISPSFIKRTLAYIIGYFQCLRMGRKVSNGENPIEFLIDVIQEYDQSEVGVERLAEFALTGMKPPSLADEEAAMTTVALSLVPAWRGGRRLLLEAGAQDKEFDHSLRSPWNNSRSWSAEVYAVSAAEQS